MKISVLLITFTLCLSSIAFAEEKVKLLIPEYTIHEASANWVYRNLQDEKDKVKQTYKETALDEFVKKFDKEGYKIEQLEIWVEGVASTGGITKLVISLEGKGGIKIVMRPQK